MIVCMTKAELYDTVSGLKNYFGIGEFDYPINTFDLCSQIKGLKVQKISFKTKDLRGMLCVAKDQTENHVILINDCKSNEEQNYHCAHEFMHLFGDSQKPGTILKCYDKVKPNQDSYTEWIANEGAAEFLILYRVFIPEFSKLYDFSKNNFSEWHRMYGLSTVEYILANLFRVSEMVITNRIKNLAFEIWQYRGYNTLDGISILSRKQQIQQHIDPPNYYSEMKRTEAERDFSLVSATLPKSSELSIAH